MKTKPGHARTDASRRIERTRLIEDALGKKANAVIVYRVDIFDIGRDQSLICA